MLTIWGRVSSSNVSKVMWSVAELGIPHVRRDVTDRAAYRRLNPNDVIPTIEDDGLVLWESNAIVRHLAAGCGAGTLWPLDPRVRADADRWMDWSSSTLSPAIAALRSAYKSGAADLEHHVGQAAAALAILDAALAGRDFVAGAHLTMGDVALGPFVHRWFLAPVARPALPAVERWIACLRARPAFTTHVAAAIR